MLVLPNGGRVVGAPMDVGAMTGVEGPSSPISPTKLNDGACWYKLPTSGIGVGSQDTERIFNPLLTTRPNGMGMGLSVCGSIIKATMGACWLPQTRRGRCVSVHAACTFGQPSLIGRPELKSPPAARSSHR